MMELPSGINPMAIMRHDPLNGRVTCMGGPAAKARSQACSTRPCRPGVPLVPGVPDWTMVALDRRAGESVGKGRQAEIDWRTALFATSPGSYDA